MPPKAIPKKLFQMPMFSSPSNLDLKSYTNAAILKNKSNPESWTETNLYKDIADSYLQTQLRFHSKESVVYRNALAEVNSPDIRSHFEKYQEKAKKRAPSSGAKEARKTESGLNVPNPRDCGKIPHLTYAGWWSNVVAVNPDVKLDKRMADEILAQFEALVRTETLKKRKLSKMEEGVLGNMWKDRKRHWQQDKAIEKGKSKWWKE